MGERQSTFVN
ncbi:unnamed protein product, partial [Rotaria sordida]